MLISFMKFSAMAFAVLGFQLPANAQSLPTRQTPPAEVVARRADIAAKERINAWTVGLAGWFIEGEASRHPDRDGRCDRKCQLAAISQRC